MKKIIFAAVFIGVFLFLGHSLNPLDRRMITFHDDTQAARIQQMALSIREGQFPPRLAPDLSYGLGFPIFNHYAPTAYWIATLFHLMGMPVVMALKFTFLLSVLLAFTAMFLLLRGNFKFFPSLIGAVTYVSSLWFAIEIFTRGNLAECWFLAIFPFALYLLAANAKRLSNTLMVLTAVAISFTLTAHNVLSLLAIALFCVYIFINKNRKRNILALILGGLFASYFLIPAIFELSLTQASQIAKLANYKDHFLCINQVWSSPVWEFGGSGIGCEKDGMPFMLGKIHILFAILGVLAFLIQIIRNKENTAIKKNGLFFLLLGAISLFLTTYQSSLVWNIFEPILSLFQFPWRFLVFVLPALSFFSAFLFEKATARFRFILPGTIILVAITGLLFTSSKFFSKPWLMSYDEYTNTYLAPSYIARTVAYNMAEYLTAKADYTYWRSFDPQIHLENHKNIPIQIGTPAQADSPDATKVLSNNPYRKEVSVIKPALISLNIHYFPFWEIYINNIRTIPDQFDKLGRPLLAITQPAVVRVVYNQTPVEKIANLLSLFTAVIMCGLIFYKPLWNKLKPYLK